MRAKNVCGHVTHTGSPYIRHPPEPLLLGKKLKGHKPTQTQTSHLQGKMTGDHLNYYNSVGHSHIFVVGFDFLRNVIRKIQIKRSGVEFHSSKPNGYITFI